MLTSLDDLLEHARTGPSRRIAVAGADHASSLQGVIDARRAGIIDRAVLVDAPSERLNAVVERLEAVGEPLDAYELVDVADDDRAVAAGAVAAITRGSADLLLKGRIATGDLLRAVLDRKAGLRTGNVLSDVLLSEVSLLDDGSPTPRLIGVTDGGVNVAPTLEVKQQIIENAVRVFHRLGFDCPRVALLCAVERTTAAMPHTEEARALVERNRTEPFARCLLDGPLALDNALSLAAAHAKGLDSPVAGQADILVVPNIEAGNILGKAFRYLAGKPLAHVIEGVWAPILIPSRTESARDKLYSIALGALGAG